MCRITSCAITGVACASMTITASSPMTTPVFGSPSAVYAYARSESRSKLTCFGARSACDANVLSDTAPPRRSDALEHERDALPDADAHRAQRVAAARALQVVERGGRKARARRAERMAEGDRAAIRVDVGSIV